MPSTRWEKSTVTKRVTTWVGRTRSENRRFLTRRYGNERGCGRLGGLAIGRTGPMVGRTCGVARSADQPVAVLPSPYRPSRRVEFSTVGGISREIRTARSTEHAVNRAGL